MPGVLVGTAEGIGEEMAGNKTGKCTFFPGAHFLMDKDRKGI